MIRKRHEATVQYLSLLFNPDGFSGRVPRIQTILSVGTWNQDITTRGLQLICAFHAMEYLMGALPDLRHHKTQGKLLASSL